MNKMIFFKTPIKFNVWLKKYHSIRTELWIGFYKKDSRKKGITYQEALDEALCFGWIDGIRKRVNDECYTIRYTPRKQKSNWSEVNIKRVTELQQLEKMQRAGLEAFERRDLEKRNQYSFKQKNILLKSEFDKKFRAQVKAWNFFRSQPPSYQKTAGFWVMSAKQEITREKRFLILLKNSENELRIPPLRYESKPPKS